MPLDLEHNLAKRCHEYTNEDWDGFVGVKADTDDAAIYFPLGYDLPKIGPGESDEDVDKKLRIEIQNLFNVLNAFLKTDLLVEARNFEAPRTVDFPIHAYLTVITNFLRKRQYYVELDPEYKTASRGNTSWPRTIREQRPLVQRNGSLVFTQMTVRCITPNTDKQITQIHRYCVYEAFDKLGWLYVPTKPEKPGPHPSIKESIYILQKKLASSHNDMEQELFGAMKKMLEYIDSANDDNRYFFGTDHFDKVWEGMIDKAFGIEDKNQFFPRTRWLLDYGKDKVKKPLVPDSIMIYHDKYYVLDAKCYRYGMPPHDADNLPNGTDINKQITYGEYIETYCHVPADKLFNAFIMPYNMNNNLFGLTTTIGNIGEAVGDWRSNSKYYERIQGIVIDTRYLMYNYYCMPVSQKQDLVNSIEKVTHRAAVPAPTP